MMTAGRLPFAFGWLGTLGSLAGRNTPFILDEGGLRLREPTTRYVPFGKMRGLRVERAMFERSRLILMTSDGVIDARLPSSVNATELCVMVERQRDEARNTATRMATTRGDLGGWIAMVSASHGVDRCGSLYRSSFVDIDLLERTLSDRTDAIEARAAAAHALLTRGHADLVTPHIERVSPPFVIAATRLAPGGDKIVSAELLDEVLPFLELRDRIVFDQHARRITRH